MNTTNREDTIDCSAAQRAEMARARAHELRQRRADLERGLPADDATVERARRRAVEALERARCAHRACANGHTDARDAHLRAAAAHEQAAVFAGDGEAEFHQDVAEMHREAARRHDEAAAEQREREADDLALARLGFDLHQ